MIGNDAHKKNEIVVIKLDIDSNKSYSKLRSIKKINLLAKRIHDVCKILQNQKPYATWIICWREYGIRDKAKKSISNKTKDKLKKIMLEISEQYPNLIIIAGSVLTRKIKHSSYLNELKKFYTRLNWLQEIEEEYNHNQIALHRNKIAEMRKKIRAGLEEIKVTANKTCVFYHGMEKRHGKTAPFNENAEDDDAIYQPGKGNNLNPVFEIHDAPLNLSFGVDICREHINAIQYLKQMVEANEVNKPFLHFIISNTVNLDLSSICAKHAAIHIDSDNPAQIILARNYKKEALDLIFYQCDAMEKINELGNPIIPQYPIQYKLLDVIDEKLNHPGCSKKKFKRLTYFRDEIIFYHSEMTNNALKELKKSIDTNKYLSTSLKKEFTDIVEGKEISPSTENVYKGRYTLFAPPQKNDFSELVEDESRLNLLEIM